MQLKEFSESAKTLAKNPLGIIALFIVMVYAIAALVISLAKPEFYQNPTHPSVIFLAVFPLCVLLVFAYLVCKHHKKLYGPGDYEDQADFVKTFDTEAGGESQVRLSSTEAHDVLEELFDAFFDSFQSILNQKQQSFFLRLVKARRPMKVIELIPDFDRANPEHIGTLRALRGAVLIRPQDGGAWGPNSYIEVTLFGRRIVGLLKERAIVS